MKFINTSNLKKSYLVILFPFLETIRYNLFGIPFIFIYFYTTKSIGLALSVLYLVFWGTHLFISGLNRGVKRFPNSNKKTKFYLALGDIIIALILFTSIFVFYNYLYEVGFTIVNVIFIIYLSFINILTILSKLLIK